MKQLLKIVPLTAAALVACNDDTGITAETQEADAAAVTVLDGIPRYATSQAYFDYGLKMANMYPEERKRLEAESGFTSMQTYAEVLLSDIDANETEILSRPEVFSFSADTIEDALMVRADIEVPASMAVAANADGLYYIGDVICKVDRYCQASVRGGDAEAVSRILSGEVQADGETSHLFRYDLGGSTLKAASTQINELKGTLSNKSLWTDYTARVYIDFDVDDDSLLGIICFQQKTKNYQKKRRRWREHRCGNAFRNVEVRIDHASVGRETFSIPDYFGENLVNHSSSAVIKRIPKYVSDDYSEDPYFNYIGGTVGTEGINGQIDIYTLFTSESNKQ